MPVAKRHAQTAKNSSIASARPARVTLNMRVRPQVRRLIDHAARLTGKNRTDFVLDAARQAAQTAVLDQTNLAMDSKAYAAFVALLDAPPKPNARLRKTLQARPPWK